MATGACYWSGNGSYSRSARTFDLLPGHIRVTLALSKSSYQDAKLLEGGPTVLQYLAEACNMQGFAAFSHDLMHHKFVFIIDDAHTTYNNSDLWLLLHSANQDGLANIPGAHFCMFIAFGRSVCDATQHGRFAEEITIFYTQDEFDLYIEIYFQGRGSDYEICEVLKDRIFGLTEGQPELINAFMDLCDMWYEAWYKKDQIDLMSFDDYEISQFFQIRGMLEATTAAIARYHDSQGLLFDPLSEAMLSYLTNGWLHLEETPREGFKCYFPTVLHNRLVEYLIGVQELRYPTPPSLNRAELKLMLNMRNMTIS
ncbi:hypothetical protein N7463_007997 [Penicillium fimorum]|uniref:Uncharacterized protein n=1 Tax=Penicillium fimorum TaxID=1882269 RepID=A0A9W9XXG2_9EURO|nr:hypothetical protein N7463_007997 [Penicillium fimorum]